MKRKILRVGRSSLAVSIPKDFLKQSGLAVSDEVNVEQRGASLIINHDFNKPIYKTINISDLSVKDDLERIMDKIIGALFKQGNDKFTIICQSKDKADIIRKIIKNGKLGIYEDPEITDNTTVTAISSISRLDENSLDNLALVMVKQIYYIFEEFTDNIKRKTLAPSLIDHLISQDKIINEHSDMCRRIINKNVKDYGSTTMYSFVGLLEKLGDAVKGLIAISRQSQKQIFKSSNVLDKIKELFYSFFLSSRNFTVKRISTFYDEVSRIRVLISTVPEPVVYHNYMRILDIMSDAYSDMMVKNI